MSSKLFWGMRHLNDNLLCAVKCELTGNDPDTHGLIQVVVLPLNHMLEIHPEIPLFDMKLRPDDIAEIDYSVCRLSRSEVANAKLKAFTKDKVADLLEDWFDGLKLPNGKKIIPLVHGWPRERQILVNWLGYTTFSKIFSEDYRDTLIAAHYINDRRCVREEPAFFNKQMLSWIAKKLNVVMTERNGAALSDCLALGQVYKRQLQNL